VTRFVSGLVLITLIVAAATVLFLPLGVLLACAVIVLLVGLACGLMLFHGRRYSTNGVFGAYALGLALKAVGIALVWFAAWRGAAEPAAAVLFTLACYFLYYVWTTWNFQLISDQDSVDR